METELQNNDGKIYELNPYVTVDELVRKLLNFPRVTYGKISETVEMDDISIKVKSFERKKKAIKIDLTAINHQNISYLINNESCYVTNKAGDKLKIAKSELIDPETEKDISFNFSITNSQGNLTFNLVRGDRQMIIDL